MASATIWRERLIAGAAAIVAIWMASELASGHYPLPLILGALAFTAIAMFFFAARVEALALGVLVFGYMVGNRGFAQLMVIPDVPLLPAELVLLSAGGWMGVRAALARQVPFQGDLLNWTVLAWMIAGTIRVFFDVQVYGLVAVRDYAMIYYAAFFYLAQQVTKDARSHRFLLNLILLTALVEPLAVVGSETFPEFFHRALSFRGIPLILFKGDLALTFIAVSAFVIAFVSAPRFRPWAWLIGAIELVFVIGGANRASMLGAFAALMWLALSRVRSFVAVAAGGLATAVLIIAALALLVEMPQAEQKFTALAERAHSLTDYFGSGTYVSEESAMKGDNNRFRSLWWRAVVDETLAVNSIFGLGFGHDLARNFLREYNPEIDDFTARSPHSIVISTFGRMGLTGLAILLGLFYAIARLTWRAMRNPQVASETLGLWACVWAILVSACFGVVLEGPMGAVVFWTLLGIANNPLESTATTEGADQASESGPPETGNSDLALPDPAPAHPVLPSP